MGVVFVNGVFFSFSLEDEVRETAGEVSTWKLAGITAIPQGRYELKMTWSPKFDRLMPELQKVPGFSSVRIHPGNSALDTEGCVLVGVQRSGVLLQDSRQASDKLNAMLHAAELGGTLNYITLENP